MSIYRSLGSLRRFLGHNTPWPVDLFSPENLPEFLDKIYVMDYQYGGDFKNFTARVWLAFEKELSLRMPWFQGVTCVLGGHEPGFTFIQTMLEIGEQKVFWFNDLSVALRFDKNILKPATLDGTTPSEHTEIKLSGNVRIDSRMDISVHGCDTLKLTPCMLGNSGIILSAEDLKVDLSATSTLPEIKAAGFDEDFRGIYIAKAAIKLPAGFADIGLDVLSLEKCAIGSQGFSGTLSATSALSSTLIGIKLAIEQFAITFLDNAITASAISGYFTIPGFKDATGTADAKIGFGVTITNNVYTLTASNIPPLKLGPFTGNLSKCVIAVRADGTVIPDIAGWFTLSGLNVTIAFAYQDDGTIKVTTDLKDLTALKLGPLTASLTKCGMMVKDGAVTPDIAGWMRIEGLTKTDNNAVEIAFKYEPDGTIKAKLEDLPSVKLGDLFTGKLETCEITVDPKGNLNPNIAGWIIIPELRKEGKGVTLNFDYTSGKIGGKVENLSCTLGSLSISDATLAISYSESAGYRIEGKGTLKIPQFSDISIMITFSEDGFQLTAEIDPCQEILNIQDVMVELAKLNIGKTQTSWNFGFSGKIENKKSLPCVGEFLPKAIEFKDFSYDSQTAPKLDLAITMANNMTFSSSGGNALIPINKEIGPVFLGGIELSINKGEYLVVEVVLVEANLKLGPILGTVNELGLQAVIEYNAKNEGVFGPVDVQLGLVGPRGIGLEIQTEIVTGGGYLAVKETGYEGTFAVSIADKFSVEVIGILTTKPPDGGNYYSLKIIGNVEFSPIQLGYGFFLCGIGLAAAINSAMDVTALQESVRDGSITSLLFPPDPIVNAPKIISDLKRFLTPSEGTHVFGVMVKIGWGGAVKLIEGDLGIFIQIGKSCKIALAGLVQAILPRKESVIVTLKFAVLGVLDLETKTISIDASLHNSKILSWPITGDMALRLGFGDKAYFALSAGGFYPGYRAPAGFPILKPLAICFGRDNPQITLASYFAITENSVQFGAAVAFKFECSFGVDLGLFDINFHIKLEGGGGFDALIYFLPRFSFESALFMRLSLDVDGTKVLFLDLDAHFSGPNVFHLWGTCSAEIGGVIRKDFPFDEYFGDALPEPQPPRINATDLLLAEIKRDENWVVVAPIHTETIVVFRHDDDTKDYLDLEGGLGFSQNLLPLQHEITKLGESELVEGSARFEITPNFGGTKNQTIETVYGNFARGMYKNLDATQRMSEPPFAKMESGFRITASNLKIPSRMEITKEVEYEIIVADSGTQTRGIQNRVVVKTLSPAMNSRMSVEAGKTFRTRKPVIRKKKDRAYKVNWDV